MKGRYQWCFILIVACCLTGQLNAQLPEGLSKGSLQEQFDHMVNGSSRYQSYKVVPHTWLNGFWGNIQDTLKSQQKLLKANKVTIDVQNKDIEGFKAKEEAQNVQIAELEKEKNSLSLLGITIGKATYHVLVWGIIAALVGGLLFFLGRFRYANGITRRMRHENQELQEKVDQQRKRMLEKEQELRRQLQDEINKRLS